MSKKETETQESLWRRFVEAYAKDNPVKFAAKQKNKEFDTIPASFVGKIAIKNGKEVIY